MSLQESNARFESLLDHLRRTWGLLDLEIGLPVKERAEPLRRFLDENGAEGEIEMEATDRRGRAIVCAVRYGSLQLDQGGRRGIVLLIKARERQAGEKAQAPQRRPG